MRCYKSLNPENDPKSGDMETSQQVLCSGLAWQPGRSDGNCTGEP